MSLYTLGMFSSHEYLQHDPEVSVFGNMCCFFCKSLSSCHVCFASRRTVLTPVTGDRFAGDVTGPAPENPRKSITLEAITPFWQWLEFTAEQIQGRKQQVLWEGCPLTSWQRYKRLGGLSNNRLRPATGRNYGWVASHDVWNLRTSCIVQFQATNPNELNTVLM